MHKSTSAHALPDTNQSVWQLTAIQLSGWTSLPILATSVLILQENSFYGAILTIIVGNALLWFIRLGIILMSYKRRQSTLDISRDYLGNFGGYFIGALLIICTLAWFIAQTSAASTTLTHLISINESPSIDKFTQMSVLLGIVSTFLCMEGIVVLRKLSTLSFPILIITFFVVIFTLPFHWPEDGTATLSLSGLALVLGANLGITSDLPTFFRHSRSLQASITALTLIQLISLVLALCSLYFGSIITSSFAIDGQAILGTGNDVLRIALIIFVFLSVICANVANVYSASVGWEVIAPTALVGRKEYLILGLGLTTIFIMISNILSTELLLNASDSSLVNLCVILIVGYIISVFNKRLPNRREQSIYFAAWLLSTLINTLQYCGIISDKISTFETGTLTVLMVVFLASITLKITRYARKRF